MSSYLPGVGISKGRKCCDLVNASYALSVNHRYDAFTRSQHLRPFEIPTPDLEANIPRCTGQQNLINYLLEKKLWAFETVGVGEHERMHTFSLILSYNNSPTEQLSLIKV